jgi:hypothetical protein
MLFSYKLCRIFTKHFVRSFKVQPLCFAAVHKAGNANCIEAMAAPAFINYQYPFVLDRVLQENDLWQQSL